ncbi:DEAD/DEAH box helicase [Desulfatitalea alkaliphila]|uniref:DEAD/DEAH box helicase n=1 Tax=Desulfatitalea alkaliphila TaxID=2929485 RepID=A0AA41UKZ2_9BACT|nr:DEAD/DEAH box helicase [Desulfatitalea alkaliphila]MCJ8502814.1 DEAD/DEAH box helicase [Desulfatitalea alkaliphila]
MGNYHHHGDRGGRRPRRSFGRGERAPIPAPRPGADAKLKKVFARIGTPDPAPFVPDDFQLRALETVARADCLVTAPTGAGKTWIALQAIAKVFEQGGRAWYASPLKALTNAKMAEFGQHFGAAHVGILTGDRKENADAPIIVGTTEILRNQLYDAMHRGETLDTDFVVLDEAHYLGDEDRGVVWEETMIYLPQRVPLLLLSATVGNAAQIARWLTAIRRKPCEVVQETRRPVPLYPLLLHPSGTLLPLLIGDERSGKTRLYKKVGDFLSARRPPLLAPPGKLPPFGALLAILRKYHLLPAIFFLKSRADCDQAVQLCLENNIEDPERAERLRQRMAELAERFPHIRRHRQRWAVEHLAVGAHHSGQLPAWKQVLEVLMSEGHLDAIFATSTVAAGVDFPARTVAFLNSDRFNGREFMPLDATELQQMTGRAGRRGKDRIGFALLVPGKYMDVRQVAKQFKAPAADVHSRIRINFSMTLNLLLSHSPPEVEHLLHRSLATFQRHGAAMGGEHAAHSHLWTDFQRHVTFLQTTGFVDDQHRLTEDGQWAAQLRIDQPLLVAEGLRLDLFPRSDPVLLAAIMASLVNDKETDEHLDKKGAPEALVQAMDKVVKGLRGFAKHMLSRGFEARPLHLKPALAIHHWAGGRPWERSVQAGQMAEGDLAMLALRTADNLRHMVALKAVFPQVADTAKEAIGRILRDPVMPDHDIAAEAVGPAAGTPPAPAPSPLAEALNRARQS